MTKRGAMFPSALLSAEDFRKLGPVDQLLFMKLWLSPNLDSAGFRPLQMSKWGRGFAPHASDAEIRTLVGNLEGAHWIAVDFDTEELLVVPYIRLDACKQPQIYVSATRSIQAAQSSSLREIAWEEVTKVHPPKLRPDPKRSPETTERLVRQQHTAFEELRDFMEAQR